MPGMPVTKAEIAAAIRNAKTVAELDELWAYLESGGRSRKGLTYAEILQRKADMGVDLSEGEKATVARAEAAFNHGQSLPPIRGAQRGAK